MTDTVTGTALEPLRALRYDADRFPLDEVVAPPYDVISPADREALLRRNDHNVVRLELPDTAQTAASCCTSGGVTACWSATPSRRCGGTSSGSPGRTASTAAARGSSRRCGCPRTRRAVCALTSARTRTPGRGGSTCCAPPAPTPRRSSRSTTTRTAGRARRWHPPPIARPTCRPPTATAPSTASGASSEPEAVAAAQAALGDREILIADGHHRYETALAYRDEQRERDGDPAGDQPYDFVLMYLANLHGEGLAIYPTHRVVMAQREVDPRFLAAFAVRELPAGTSPAQVESELNAIDPATVAFALWRGSDQPALIAQVKDTSTVMMAMPGAPKALRAIDAAVLEALVLAPLLGLDGDQFLTTDQVRYVRGLDTATALVDSGEAGSAFLLRAPTVEQVQAVAAAGRVMPQKSTYFFPKLATGFLLNPLAAE